MDSPFASYILSYPTPHTPWNEPFHISVSFSSLPKPAQFPILRIITFQQWDIFDQWLITRQAVFSPWIFGIELKWNLNLFGIVPSGTYQWNFIPYDNKKIFLHAIYKITPCGIQLRIIYLFIFNAQRKCWSFFFSFLPTVSVQTNLTIKDYSSVILAILLLF